METSPGNPGQRRMSLMPTGITGSSIHQTHVIVSMTFTLEKKTLTAAPCVLVRLFATCKFLGT